MENNYLDNPYFEHADMYSLRLRDLIKKMSPTEWKAFEIIAASLFPRKRTQRKCSSKR